MTNMGDIDHEDGDFEEVNTKLETMRVMGWLWCLCPGVPFCRMLSQAIGEREPETDDEMVAAVEAYLWRNLPGVERFEENLRTVYGEMRFQWAQENKVLRVWSRDNLKTLALWGGRNPEPPNNRDVHTEHCCVEHGCKYGDKGCTVGTKKKVQSYICETCYEDIRELDAESY